MRRATFAILLAAAPVAAAPALCAEAPELRCVAGSVCRDPLTELPGRILTRPFANVYASEDDSAANILAENLRAFTPLYIFDRRDADYSDPAEPRGWYLVGETVAGEPLGWMQARDVVEWRQALVVAFTHPGVGEEERHPVLMFQDRESLKAVLQSPTLAEDAEQLYQQVDAALEGGPAAPMGVVSMEPKSFIDIREQFYLMPVLQFEETAVFDDETRLLHIAAVTQDRAGEGGSDLLDDPGYRETVARGELQDAVAGALGVDIVFVMDMTGSMQPFIDQVTQAMGDLARFIAQENVAERIRFGLVGFRDSIALLPELEFTALNFTPRLLPVDEFVNTVGSVIVESPIDHDFEEEVFAGVQEALGSAWNEPSLRFFVLVGDASQHFIGHPQNTTNIDAETLRQQLNTEKINLIALHLISDRYPQDEPYARAQFTALAANPGMETPAYIRIDVNDQQSYLQAVKTIGENLSLMMGLLARGDVEGLGAMAAGGGPAASVDALSKQLGYAALVPYLGRESRPPRDITAWVVDRDMVRPEASSLEVRVLLTRQQLNDLIIALEAVLKSVKQAEVTQSKFFEALSGIAVTTAKGEAIDYTKAEDLKDTGLFEPWLQSLPYKSTVLSLSDEFYAALTMEEKAGFEIGLESKLSFYQELMNSDKWIALNDKDPPLEHVYPMELGSLP